MEEIQALNAVGLECLVQGDLKEAASAFSYCLSRLSWCILSPTPFPPSNKSEKQRMDCGEATDSHHSNCDRQSDSTTTAAIEIRSLDEALRHVTPFSRQSEFFSQPFYFYCNDEDQEPLNTDKSAMMHVSSESFLPSLSSLFAPTSSQHLAMSICCLFNLGLCYHIKWQRKQNQVNARLLLKALCYYEQAFSLASDHGSNDSPCFSSPQDPAFEILMAVCTNATHCHNELGNLGEMKQWNLMLCRILRFCYQRKDGSKALQRDDNDYSLSAFFALNAFFNGISQNVARAA